MRPRRDCLGDMSLRILVGSLAAVVLGALLACGQLGDDEPVEARVPTPEAFDLLEAGFHQSTVGVALGERVEVSVEVRQERHDQHICGVPSVVDRSATFSKRSLPDRTPQKGRQPTMSTSRGTPSLPLRTVNTASSWKIGGVCSTMWVPSRPCNGRSTRCRNDGSESRY